MTQSNHGMPCWYELSCANLAGAEAFYAKVMGWTVADSGSPGMQYWIARAGDAMVAGMMAAEAGQPLGWTLYFTVTNCDETAALAASLGATVIVPPADIPNTGRFSILIDPQGAGFGILQPLPMENGPANSAFDTHKTGHGNWHELITPDPIKGLTFYAELFGWSKSRSVPMGPDMTYHIFKRGDLELGGSCALPDAPPHWKPYFGSSSTQAAVKTVTAAGGKVLHGPDEVPSGAFTLQIEDAQGIRLALTGPA